MNHWPECLDIWYGTSYGQGDSRQLRYFELFNKLPTPNIMLVYIGF